MASDDLRAFDGHRSTRWRLEPDRLAAAARSRRLSRETGSRYRQIKADMKFDKSGAYALHQIVLPVALLGGETITEVNIAFTDSSQSGKVYVDAVSLTVTPPIVLRGDGGDAGRTATDPRVLPLPASPGGFRGQN